MATSNNAPQTGQVQPAPTQVAASEASFASSLRKMLRENIRDYGMYIALFAIWAFFTATTKGLFISSRNISNLLNQTGYIAVIAVGMTLVIVIRHIDLSVGFLSGFLAALAAIAMMKGSWPVWVVIPLSLVVGMGAGAITAFLVAQLGIPAFVATLGGWLVYRGLLLLVLAGTGTIIIESDLFNDIGNGFVPDLPGLANFMPGVHKLTLLLGIVAIVLFIIGQFRSRRQKMAYNFEVLPMNLFIVKLAFIALLLAAITWVLPALVLLYHLGEAGIIPGADRLCATVMVHLLMLLIAVVGGRVIPLFTANWLRMTSGRRQTAAR